MPATVHHLPIRPRSEYRIDRVYRPASGNPRYVGYCPGGYEYEVVRVSDESTVVCYATKREALQYVKQVEAPRQTLRDLCEPSREQDEALLRVIAAYEAEGGQVLFDEPADEPKPVEAAQPFVSEYLTRPLRTEDEARAQLNRPRIPRAKGLLEMIAEQSGIDAAFRRIVGGQ